MLSRLLGQLFSASSALAHHFEYRRNRNMLNHERELGVVVVDFVFRFCFLFVFYLF